MILYTHYSLDLDAASTLALAFMVTGALRVKYISADITKKEFTSLHYIEEDFLMLDIDCEGLGIKGKKIVKDGQTYILSAFSSYLALQTEDYKEAFKDLALFIDQVDSGNKLPAASLYGNWLTIFLAIKRKISTDPEVLEAWFVILEGHYKNKESKGTLYY